MMDFNIDFATNDASRMAKFKIGDEVVDPASGLNGTVVKVEVPQRTGKTSLVCETVRLIRVMV